MEGSFFTSDITLTLLKYSLLSHVPLTLLPTQPPTLLPTHPPTLPLPPTVSDTVIFDSGYEGGTGWSGTLIEATDNINRSNQVTTVRLISGGRDDWFIRFNGVKVTISKVKNGQSALMGTLNQGKATISNWRSSDFDLVIKVNKIYTNVNPAYVDVEITFGPRVR